jgi:hypothetical protein
MLSHLKDGGLLTSVSRRWMLYDPFTYHRGAAALESAEGRVFIMICDGTLTMKEKAKMAKTNDIKVIFRNLHYAAHCFIVN